MNVHRFDRVDAFYDRAAPFLLAREAEHNLILGLCVDIARHPERYVQQPYFGLVERVGEVVQAGLMTPPHNLTLSLSADPAALGLLLDDVAAFTPRPPGVSGAAEVCAAFASMWQERGLGAVTPLRSLRIYKNERVRPVAGVPGVIRPAEERDRATLAGWFAAFDREALGVSAPQNTEQRVDAFLHSDVRGLRVWEHGSEAVAMAGFSGPTPNSIRIVAVYTPPEHRRHGYASALVAQLTQALLDEGRAFCTLFTDLSNPTSNHIYQEIGYEPVIDTAEWRLG